MRESLPAPSIDVEARYGLPLGARLVRRATSDRQMRSERMLGVHSHVRRPAPQASMGRASLLSAMAKRTRY